MTVQEAADQLGVKRSMIYTYVGNGRLKAKQNGQRVWTITTADFEAFAKLPRQKGHPKIKPDPVPVDNTLKIQRQESFDRMLSEGVPQHKIAKALGITESAVSHRIARAKK